jgi:hypothetical protein
MPDIITVFYVFFAELEILERSKTDLCRKSRIKFYREFLDDALHFFGSTDALHPTLELLIRFQALELKDTSRISNARLQRSQDQVVNIERLARFHKIVRDVAYNGVQHHQEITYQNKYFES